MERGKECGHIELSCHRIPLGESPWRYRDGDAATPPSRALPFIAMDGTEPHHHAPAGASRRCQNPVLIVLHARGWHHAAPLALSTNARTSRFSFLRAHTHAHARARRGEKKGRAEGQRRGLTRQSSAARHGTARHGTARHGTVRLSTSTTSDKQQKRLQHSTAAVTYGGRSHGHWRPEVVAHSSSNCR